MSSLKTFFIFLFVFYSTHSLAFCPDGNGGSDSTLQLNRIDALEAKGYETKEIFDREIIGGYSPGGTPLIVTTYSYQMVNDVGHTYLVTCNEEIESPFREGVYFYGSSIVKIKSSIDKGGQFRVDIKTQSWERDVFTKEMKSHFNEEVNPSPASYKNRGAFRVSNPTCIKNSDFKQWPNYASITDANFTVSNYKDKIQTENELQAHIQNVVNTQCQGRLENCDIFSRDKLLVSHKGKYGLDKTHNWGEHYWLTELHKGHVAPIIGNTGKVKFLFKVKSMPDFSSCIADVKMSYIINGENTQSATQLILKNDSAKSDLVDVPESILLLNGQVKVINQSVFNVLIKGIAAPQQVLLKPRESITISGVSNGYIDISLTQKNPTEYSLNKA